MAEKSKKILLIEDEEMIRSMYSVKLEQDGFEVATAKDGLEGLEKMEDGDFDLVLLDIIMPQVDGFSVLEKIKSKKEKKDIPVLMLTNLSTEEDRKKGKELGASGYLVKSLITPSQMSKEILKYL